MDEERLQKIERELAEIKEIAEENNDLMRKMLRMDRISFWSKIIIWLIILILPFYLYSAFLAPLLSAAGSTGVFGLPSADQMKSLMDAYQGLYGE